MYSGNIALSGFVCAVRIGALDPFDVIPVFKIFC